MSILVFDIEGNGLNPNIIFVLGVLDYETGEYTDYTCEDDNIAEGLLRLAEADLVVGHYVKGYDIPVIERLTEGLITIDRAKVCDTYELSYDLFPRLRNHKLRTFGEILGFPKGEWHDFSKYDPGMRPYCKTDCLVTGRLLEFLLGEIENRQMSVGYA